MGSSSFKKITENGIRGVIRKELLQGFPSAFLKNPTSFVQETGGKVIKVSKWRWAALLTLPGGRRIFLKRDRTKGGLEYLKYLFLPSKARKEWAIAVELEKRNLPVPQPLGWMEKTRLGVVRESYYLSEARGTGLTAFDTPEQLRAPSIIEHLARHTKTFHDGGLYHRDFHAGNLLWENDSLLLTDLHSASILGTLSLRKRLWNLTHLFHSAREAWGEKEQREFLDVYFGGEAPALRRNTEFLQRIHRGMDRLQKRQWRSRTKRCLKNSTEFSFEKEGNLTVFRRRDFSLDELRAVVEGHRSLVREKPEGLTKHSPKVIVSLTQRGGKKFAVKHFCYPCLWDRLKDLLRRSKGRKAWIGGNGLKARGISSVQPLALVETGHWLGPKESFFLMETLEGSQELDRYVLQGFGDFRRKRIFIRAFAGWLADLYNKNIYHKDMKTCNFLVVEKQRSWDFHLLDLEDVRFGQRMTERKLFKNFFQLNTSTPRLISRTDRLRFAKECLGRIPDIKNAKRLLRQVAQGSQGRDVVYVSPHGTVIEKL